MQWTTCPADNSTVEISEKVLWHNGLSFHTLAIFVSFGFGCFAALTALFLIFMHGISYSKPYEQKHIMRILMMIPIYAVISFLSEKFYKHAIYFNVIRDCYEAFAIASFFTLLCHYVAPNLHEQKNYFRTITPKNWFWGVFGLQYCTGGQNRGPFRKPRSGLTWFNVVWIGVFQYCLVRVVCTIEALITELVGRYCLTSWSPFFGHFWYQTLTAISVTIAMFCLIQFYIQTKDDLAEHKPLLKVLCIKLVIFFSFWQNLVINALASQYGPVRPTAYVVATDITITIPSLLVCVEMAFFSIMHIFAFSWRPYRLQPGYDDPTIAAGIGYGSSTPKYHGGPLGIKAFFDALNPWDIIKASARGFRWLFVGVRHREKDVSYQNGKLDATDEFLNSSYTATGEVATELRPSRDGRGRPSQGGTGSNENDRTGLLEHSGGFGRVPTRNNSPYQPSQSAHRPADDPQYDIGVATPYTNSKPVDYGDTTNTSYYGTQHQQPSPMSYPAQRQPTVEVHDPNWDMFGGGSRPDPRSGGARYQHEEEYPARI